VVTKPNQTILKKYVKLSLDNSSRGSIAQHVFAVGEQDERSDLINRAMSDLTGQFNNLVIGSLDLLAQPVNKIEELPHRFADIVSGSSLPAPKDDHWYSAVDRLQKSLADRFPNPNDKAMALIFMNNAESLYDDMGYGGPFKRATAFEGKLRSTFYDNDDVKRLMLVQLSEKPVDGEYDNYLFHAGIRFNLNPF
jgi:hypothetical protein